MLARIVRWSLERPRLITWACLLFLIWGGFTIRDARVDLLPNLAPAETTIQTEAPGLVAEQVEDLVTRPIENRLVGAAGVAAVQSESAAGLSLITVRFSDGVDPFRARQSVAEGLAALAGTLPSVAAPPRIAPLTDQGADTIKIGFTSAKLDPMSLRDLVQWTVRPRLLSAPGVARVAVYGGQTRRIEVRARPADLSDSDLGFLDILNAVKRATSVVGAGFIDTPNQRVAIEPRGQALTPDDVAAGQIQTPGSAPVRIADVSDVVETAAPAFGDALINGRPGVLVMVARQYGANTLETTHAVEGALATLRPAMAEQGVTVDATLDRPATFTTAAIGGVARDLLIGAVLIALVLSVFMREPRAVLISLVSIPLSLLAAVIALRSLGWSLNAMTLGGLAVGLGVVIDDAVIGVENVMTRLADAQHTHKSDLEVVLKATLEVRAPVIYAAGAVIIILAPLLLLKGQQGALLGPLAAAIIAASLASLVVATVATPAFCLLFHHHAGLPPEPRALVRLKDRQARWVEWVGARAGAATIGVLAISAVAIAGLAVSRFELLPSVHDGALVAQASAPPSTVLEVMRAYGTHVSAEILKIPGVTSVAQRIGRDATGDDSWGPERTAFDIALKPGLGAGAQDRIARNVREALKDHPGLSPTVASRFDATQRALGAAAPVKISLYGQDLDALGAAAGQIAATIKTLPGARDVRTDAAPRGPVVRVDLNFPRLALYGLSAADVLDTVQAAFAGERVGQIYVGGRVVDLAVSAQDTLRRDPEAVGELLLRSTSGVSVPLKTVANVYLTDGPVTIAHEGGLRREIITASPDNADRFIRQARQAIEAKVKLPPGAFLEFGGSAKAAGEARRDLLINYAAALFAVLALLSIAFDGRTAALILLSTLLSFVGATAVLWMMGGVLSTGALAGFFALFGVSMRGAILLFGRLDELVQSHQNAWSLETVIIASRERLTPVLMTSVLLALSLTPLAFEAGQAGREILGPMALIILGGLVTGALANLIILPALIHALWRAGYARLARRHVPLDPLG